MHPKARGCPKPSKGPESLMQSPPGPRGLQPQAGLHSGPPGPEQEGRRAPSCDLLAEPAALRLPSQSLRTRASVKRLF